MDKIEDILNKVIENANLSKNEIIRQAGLNRSTFYQILSGKREPTEQQVSNLIRILQLSYSEEMRLRECFVRQKLGANTWENRQIVKKCIQKLARMDDIQMTEKKTYEIELRPKQGNCYHTGREKVFYVLNKALDAELESNTPKLQLFIPNESNAFYEHLKYSCWKHRENELNYCQILQFDVKKNVDDKSVLEHFNDALFFLALKPTGFSFYYYYDNSKLANARGVLFPYYILCNNCAFLISENYESVLEINSPEQVEAYHVQFNTAICTSKSLTKHYSGYESLAIQWQHDEMTYSFSGIPCFALLASDELIVKYVAKSLRSELRAHCRKIQNSNRFSSMTSIDGLARFVECGKIEECPDGLVGLVEPADRKIVLETLLARVESGDGRFHLIDEQKISSSQRWILSAEKNKAVILYRKDTPNFELVEIAEKTVVDAFIDFFQTVENGLGVYSKSTTVEILTGLIQRCDEIIAAGM